MSARIEVVRAFYFEGAVLRPGDVVAVSPGLAAELISYGKARLAPPLAPPDPIAPPRRPRRADPEPNLIELET